jgi:hypothetical protein
VQRVAEFTPEPIADNSILRGVFFYQERMLDEVTLICVRDNIERIDPVAIQGQEWGFASRNIAKNICRGIDQFDAEQ